MRSIATALLFVLLATPTLAVDIQDIGLRTAPRYSPVVSITPQTVGTQVVDPEASPVHLRVPTDKVAVILNCENDNTINLANTLLIGPGDLVGNIFTAPGSPNPFHIREVTFGLVDFGQTYPATLLMEFYEDNLAGSFVFLTAVTFTIPVSPGGGTLYTADISALNIVASNDILTLYGDDAPSGAGYMIPTGDDSPRCFTGANVCSVHVPAANPSLFIYGLGDPNCPPQNILLLDLTHELVVDEVPVSNFSSSFGGVKAEFEEED